jgi:hypothetical protein
VFGPSSSSTSSAPPAAAQGGLTQPVNKALESGAWAQSIIWDKHTPFRDFTQIEFNHEDDIIPQTRPSADGMRPRKRLKADAVKTIDKFNLSNDAHYELSVKEGARQRVRQTFGQITVEHAHPAQKLQLPFVCVDFLGQLTFPEAYLYYSTRHVYRNKRLDRGIVRPCSSRQMWSYALAKFVQPRKRKTRPDESLGEEATWAKGCTALQTCLSQTPAISSCGSFPRNYRQSCQVSEWAVCWSTTTGRKPTWTITFQR